MPGTTIPRLRRLDGVIATSTRLSQVDDVGGELIIGGYALEGLAGRVSFEESLTCSGSAYSPGWRR